MSTFEENKHPRDKEGKFSSSSSASAPEPDLTAPSRRSLENFLQGDGDKENAIPFDEDYVVKIGNDVYKIRLEGWFPDCLESRGLGKTTVENIRDNFEHVMEKESGWKPDWLSYMPNYPGAAYGVSLIGKKIN